MLPKPFSLVFGLDSDSTNGRRVDLPPASVAIFASATSANVNPSPLRRKRKDQPVRPVSAPLPPVKFTESTGTRIGVFLRLLKTSLLHRAVCITDGNANTDRSKTLKHPVRGYLDYDPSREFDSVFWWRFSDLHLSSDNGCCAVAFRTTPSEYGDDFWLARHSPSSRTSWNPFSPRGEPELLVRDEIDGAVIQLCEFLKTAATVENLYKTNSPGIDTRLAVLDIEQPTGNVLFSGMYPSQTNLSLVYDESDGDGSDGDSDNTTDEGVPDAVRIGSAKRKRAGSTVEPAPKRAKPVFDPNDYEWNDPFDDVDLLHSRTTTKVFLCRVPKTGEEDNASKEVKYVVKSFFHVNWSADPNLQRPEGTVSPFAMTDPLDCLIDRTIIDDLRVPGERYEFQYLGIDYPLDKDARRAKAASDEISWDAYQVALHEAKHANWYLKSEFQRELELIQLCQSPYVIRPFAYWTSQPYTVFLEKVDSPGLPYSDALVVRYTVGHLAMELATNGTLYSFVSSMRPFVEAYKSASSMWMSRVVPGLMKQIVDCVQHLHSLGVLHLNLNPNHFVIDSAGQLKLIDFAAAKRAGDSRERVDKGSWQSDYSVPFSVSAPAAWKDLYLTDAELHKGTRHTTVWRGVGVDTSTMTANLAPSQYLPYADHDDAWSMGRLFEFILNPGLRHPDALVLTENSEPLQFFKPAYRDADKHSTLNAVVNRLLNPDPRQRMTVAEVYNHPLFAEADPGWDAIAWSARELVKEAPFGSRPLRQARPGGKTGNQHRNTEYGSDRTSQAGAAATDGESIHFDRVIDGKTGSEYPDFEAFVAMEVRDRRPSVNVKYFCATQEDNLSSSTRVTTVVYALDTAPADWEAAFFAALESAKAGAAAVDATKTSLPVLQRRQRIRLMALDIALNFLATKIKDKTEISEIKNRLLGDATISPTEPAASFQRWTRSLNDVLVQLKRSGYI